MSFKENLKLELEFKDIKVKELAATCGISRRTIDQYLASNAKMPSAENAVKIAQALNVSVEYLVTGFDKSTSNSCSNYDQTQVKKYIKYHDLIETCENLPNAQVKLLVEIAKNFSNKTTNDTN